MASQARSGGGDGVPGCDDGDSGNVWSQASTITRPFDCPEMSVNAILNAADCPVWATCPDEDDWYRTDARLVGLSDTLAIDVCNLSDYTIIVRVLARAALDHTLNAPPIGQYNFRVLIEAGCHEIDTTLYLMAGGDWFIHVSTGTMRIVRYSMSVN